MRERISLIATIFSELNGLEMVGHLHGEDAQAFVDVIDKVCSRSSPEGHVNRLRLKLAPYRIGAG